MHIRIIELSVCALAVALLISGCTKPVPQPEIDAAESSMSALENYKNCAPETYQAAKTMMDRSRALLKEKRYDEAKTTLVAAKQLADKAAAECEKRRREEAELKAKTAAEPAVKEIEVSNENVSQDLATVYFGFNESSLTGEAQTILTNNAELLRKNPNLHIQIEGNCDSRGSTEYNLALGERRALTVKQYLAKLGLSPDRFSLISYGEERPVDSGQTEEAYAKNRRADFTVLK
jgi:peptidoglycan-associated lipoprotein